MVSHCRIKLEPPHHNRQRSLPAPSLSVGPPHQAQPQGGAGRKDHCRFKMARRSPRQIALPAPRTWGGRRRGAGRKPSLLRPGPAHAPRPEHHARHPVHVTFRARDGISSLRADRTFAALSRALADSSRASFGVVHFSIQSNHIHLIVEADDAQALVRGLQGLAVRCARAINRSCRRCGPVWSERHHTHALRTPREMRLALAYLLLNFRKHIRAPPGVDPCSSGPWFDAWAQSPAAPPGPSPVAAPRTWLASVGWRRAGGPIDLREAPRSRPTASVENRSKCPDGP